MTERERAEHLYKKVDTFILTCIGSDGYPMTKAVVPGKYRESLNELYFSTNTSSKFANEVSKNQKASVYFYSKDLAWEGCYLKGDMEIVTDMNIKEKYWLEEFKDAYTQQSFTDPDFCMLRFVPNSGRFYEDYTIADFEI
ncbi:MAG: pyridoxamine 5'-phosphate oxidase family protein [Defluviitaleaceae bacterium]|nr:pyridoxamine 5'-phosphate oxidase family protein [Defluviitaleaceae bacterium]